MWLVITSQQPKQKLRKINGRLLKIGEKYGKINGKYEVFEKKMIVGHVSYFQPSLEQSDNFRWQADLVLELPIWKFFNFRISYLHTFESIVIEGQEQEDRILSFGFTLKSY